MKNKSELLGLVANIFAVVLLLCFIVLGLNRIGVYSLPEGIEKLLGTNNKSHQNENEDDNIYDSMNFNDSVVEFSNAEIDYENAISVLREVSAVKDYSHEINVKRFQGKNVREESMKIVRKDGLYDITVTGSDGKTKKHISEKGTSVLIETPINSNNVYSVELEKGDFKISDDCGFILTVDEFLESNMLLDESTFSLNETDKDIFLTITFDSEYNGIVQKTTYTVSLNYGIVTDVVCVENGAVVFTMSTEDLYSDSANDVD